MINIIFFFCFVAFCSTNINFYVSKTGNDINDGSFENPFLTIGKAKESVSKIEKGITEETKITVNILEGTYHEFLEFSSLDSAKNGSRIIYQNYKNSKVTISGGKKIESDWEYDEKTKSFKTFVGIGTKSMQFYVNGERKQRCRSNSSLPEGTVITDYGFEQPYGYMSDWEDVSEIEFIHNAKWTTNRCSIDNITSSGTIYMIGSGDESYGCWGYTKVAKIHHRNNYGLELPTHIENHINFLTDQGEWFLSSKTGYLYYIPLYDEDLSNSECFLAVENRLILGTGTMEEPIENISFKGLIFAYAGWNYDKFGGNPTGQATRTGLQPNDDGFVVSGNIQFDYAKGIEFIENSFIHLGGIGLRLNSGTQNCVISSNIFHDISSIGFLICDFNRYRSDDRQKCMHNNIYNNTLTDLGLDYYSAPGLTVGYCFNCSIVHNTIKNVEYSGMSVGWGWNGNDAGNYQGENYIAYNFINNTMNTLRDGGSLYTLGIQRGTIIHRNLFMHNNNCYGSLYLDQGSRFMNCSENVILDTIQILHIHQGADNQLFNNYWQVKEGKTSCNQDDLNIQNWWYCMGAIEKELTLCGENNFFNNTIISNLTEVPEEIWKNTGSIPYIYEGCAEDGNNLPTIVIASVAIILGFSIFLTIAIVVVVIIVFLLMKKGKKETNEFELQ